MSTSTIAKKVLLTIFSLFILSSVNFALAADTNTHARAAEQLLDVLSLRTNLEHSIAQALNIQIKENPDLAKHKVDIEKFYAKYMGFDALKDEMVRMYMDAFTEQELKEIIRFYQTSTGKKIVNVVPKLMNEGIALGQRQVQAHIGELQQIVGKQK